VVFRQQPKLSTGNHFGGRLVFDGKGYLFIGLGENNQRSTAQDLDKLQGKVVRLTADGKVPDDNPLSARLASGRKSGLTVFATRRGWR
jgi:glucose/arabinose dehydrogenase